MRRSWWCLVLSCGAVIGLAACSGGGEAQPDAEVNYVTTPTDPLAAEATLQPAPSSTLPPSSTTQQPVATVPQPYNPRGNAYFVSLTGDDENAGSSTQPFRTIAKGMDIAKPGDTVFVRAGNYTDTADDALVMVSWKNGRDDAWITLAAYPGERPVLNASGWDPKYQMWRAVGVQYSSFIEIRGFEMIGTAKVDHQPASGVEILESNHVRIIDNRIHDFGGAGFSALYSNHFDVLNNVIWSTSAWNPYQTSGISSFQAKNTGGPDDADGYSIHIKNNIVHSVENVTPPAKRQPVTDGNCIIIDEHREFGYSGSTLVDNNLCFNNGGRGVNVLRGDKVTIINNTLYHNLVSPAMDDDGELSVVFSADITLRNNLVVALANRAESVVIDSTAVFDKNLYGRAGAKKQSNTDIATDAPLLRDPDKQDFRLATDSPAVNSGSSTSAPTDDLTGRARVGTPDIGAIESTG